MKRFTKSELKKYLQSEVEKIGLSEGWIKHSETIVENKAKEKIFESSNDRTICESENVQIEEVKLLAEEVKRMKELVDFRSPLLKKN